MIFSKQEMFSEAQALSGTGAAASTNIIDLGAPGTVLGAPVARDQDVGKGRTIQIYAGLDVAAGGTSPTISAALEMDNDVAFGSATIVETAPTITDGTAGQRIALFNIREGVTERYIRINYTSGGTSPTHTVTAGVVLADETS